MNPSSPLHFAAAAAAIALTTSRRLIRNFRYYRNESNPNVYRDDLLKLCRSIRQDAYGLQNLMARENSAPFLVSLAGQICDRLEELHRNLLFFEAASIAEIIPLVDRQRHFWKNFTDTEFYSLSLVIELEGPVPTTLEQIEVLIEQLSHSAEID